MPLYRRDAVTANMTTAITGRPSNSVHTGQLPPGSIGDADGETNDGRHNPAELVLLQGEHGQCRVQPTDGTAEDGGQAGDASGEGGDAHQQYSPEVDTRESRAKLLMGKRQQHQHNGNRIQRGQHRHGDFDDRAQPGVGHDEAEHGEDDLPSAVTQRSSGDGLESSMEVGGAGADQSGAYVEACDDEHDAKERGAERAEQGRGEVGEYGGTCALAGSIEAMAPDTTPT